MGERSGRAQVGLSALILLALGLALLLAGPGGAMPTDPEAVEPSLDPEELARISVEATPEVSRQVERVRELRFDEIPTPEVVDSEYLNRLGARELRDQAGGLGIAADDAIGRITGLLAPDEDLRAAYESTGDLAAAAYDSRDGRLYVVSDAVVANEALVDFVLAHELDHALEDQNFGIGGGGKLDDDGALARQALTEGSATALMTDYATRYVNPFQLLAAARTIDAGTGDVPKAYIDQLTWTYLGGMDFINELRRLAGSWKLVDYAFSDRPPATTEQVIHPEKYVRDELPSEVAVDPAPLRSRGWRPVDRNVFGELATTNLLAIGAPAAEAEEAAAGWDGDVYELWRREVGPGQCEDPCRADLVLVAAWRWDTEDDASEFDRAWATYVEDGLAGDELRSGVWRVEGGFVARAEGQRKSAAAFAPDEETAVDVAAAQVDG